MSVFQNKAINGWPLFFLVALPMCGLMVLEMLRHDLSSPPDVSEMIGYSVRFAVPLIFMVIAASSMRVLFPNAFTTWWLRNRKFIGLMFAVAMGWQGFFIFLMSNFHADYYYDEIFYLRDELEGSTGYIFLAAMVVTSFEFGRKRLSPRQWKLLHTAGVYFLWAYPFSVYWWNLSFYPNPQTWDYVMYPLGFAAFAVRILAWGKKRRQKAARSGNSQPPVAFRLLGGGLMVAGLAAAVTGRAWQDTVTTFLTTPAWSANLELWLPFWPLEPFLPLFAIGLGVMFWTHDSQAVGVVQAEPQS